MPTRRLVLAHATFSHAAMLVWLTTFAPCHVLFVGSTAKEASMLVGPS